MNYTNSTFSELITKISNARFWDLPKMLAEALRKIQQPKYKVYTALLSQSGTDAPIATVLENSLGGDVIWSYVGIGIYRATLPNGFSLNKTGIIVGSNINISEVDSATLNSNDLSASSFLLNTYDLNTQAFNGVLSNTLIEVRVYN